MKSSIPTRLLRRPLTSSSQLPSFCANNTRTFASSRPHNAAAAAPPPPPASGYIQLTTRRLISLSGPDSVKFLQGVITADIAPSNIPRTQGFYAAFLNAKGRVVNDAFIYPDISSLIPGGKYSTENGGDGKAGERWIVEVDAEEVKQLYTHLRRYKLRAKVDLRVIGEEEMGVWQSWRGEDEGAGTKWRAHTIPSVFRQTSSDSPLSSSKDGYISLTDPRAPGLGQRLLVPGTEIPDSETEGLERATLESYTIRRYLHGVPEGQGEILRESALPQESNIDYMSGISYRKGCYVGQELTIRTHHTGVVRKRILPVMLYPSGSPEPEMLEYKPDENVEVPSLEAKINRVEKEKRARGLGKFLRGIGNIGLGICRLDSVVDGIKYEAKWEVEGVEKSVGVKAFVPSWHLNDAGK